MDVLHPIRGQLVRTCSIKGNFMLNNDSSDTIQVRLTLDVTYVLNGEDGNDMLVRLRRMCERAIGEGLLTGETGAEVDVYDIKTVRQPEPLSEEELAGFMRRRIEDGHLCLEDIPVRLARYGLMEPQAFLSEMRERMDGEVTSDFN
jgi:hypothetical protein